MKILITSLLFIVLASLATVTSAQTIYGNVVDRTTGEPLTGATIQLMNSFRGVETDAKGSFTIEIPADKSTTLKVSFIGYTSVQNRITLKKGESVIMNFTLTSQVVLQDEVIISATRIATARANVPLTTSVINSKEIESSSEINMIPLIGSNVPGLFVTERGITGFGVADGSAGKISVRGVGSSDQSQLLVMVDGQPQVMGIFGHAFPDMYQTSNFEKVEVIRGPASVLYGSNAMGGVINLITKKQQSDGFNARVTAQIGSYSTLRGTITTGYKKGNISLFGSFNHDQTDGSRINSKFRGDNGYLGFSLKMNDHFKLDWTGNYSSFYAVDPGSIYSSTPGLFTDNKAWADIKRGNTMLTLSNNYEKVNGHLKVFYNQGHHSIYTNWVSTDRNYGFSLFEGLSLLPNNLIGVGIDWNQYGGIGTPVMTTKLVDGVVKVLPSEYNNKWISVSEEAAYLFMQQQLFSTLTINGGLRYSIHSLYGGQFIPQVGVTWQATENDLLKALASKGYRSPNVKELYFFPPANPDLKPESLMNYEVGYTHYALKRKLASTITLFCLNGNNLIMTLPNPSGGLPSMLNQNSGKFIHYGAEVEAVYHINPNFQLNASYSYLHTDVPRVAAPKHQFHAGGNYSSGKFDFALSLHGIAGLYTLTDNAATKDVVEKDIQDYLLMNAKINYRVLPSLNIFVSGENLLNSVYSINYGYPMPGMTLFGGFSLTLN
jgi:outer membrane cobalamin receptor